MTTQRYIGIGSTEGGERLTFEAVVSGRHVTISVDATTINKLSLLLQYTDSPGHAAWHYNNPNSALPCPSCTDKRGS